MFKRILILGVAALALALIGPAVGGSHVAKAQTAPDQTAPDQADPPDAPDQADPPDAPDQADPPEAPQQDGANDQEDAEDGPCSGSDARASGDSCLPQRRQQLQQAPNSRPGKGERHHSSGSGSGGQEVGSNSTVGARPTQVLQTTPVSAGVDTGTIPQGGIQAGAGGTADGGSNAGLLGGGALVLLLAAGSLTLRRRNGLAS
jgi:hypothetical protein